MITNIKMYELTKGEINFLYDSFRELSYIYNFEAAELIDECRAILEPHITNNKVGEVNEST